MPANPAHVEALAKLIGDNPGLQNGWLGRSIATIVEVEPRFIETCHDRQFNGFQRRLHRKYGHLLDVSLSPIHQHIYIWSWWACGFHDPIPSWWTEKLDKADHHSLMKWSAPLIRDKSLHRIPLLRLLRDFDNPIFQKTGK